ncbi:MAG TPA: hypothetical protein VEF89_31185 [Solirubrobacteraceae bacterium]|nr:hypothetical protein [Solirubrobacteraceae bacterium]
MLGIQEFVATGEGDWTVTSAPPECCIAVADVQAWPCASVWLLPFHWGSVAVAVGLARDCSD